MKFCAFGDEDIHIALLNGHTAVVPPGGVELAPMFHREAIARGCLPETLEGHVEVSGEKGFQRAKVIGENMEAMIKEALPKDFTATGNPDLRKLNALCGFQVSREEADTIWAEVSKG